MPPTMMRMTGLPAALVAAFVDEVPHAAVVRASAPTVATSVVLVKSFTAGSPLKQGGSSLGVAWNGCVSVSCGWDHRAGRTARIPGSGRMLGCADSGERRSDFGRAGLAGAPGQQPPLDPGDDELR